MHVGDRFVFTIRATKKRGRGIVIDVLPWSLYPYKVEWFDTESNRHVEQFNMECFEEVVPDEGV